MRESYREGLAVHSGPEPCGGGRKAALEALDIHDKDLSRENTHLLGLIVWANGFGKMQQTFDRTGLHIEASDLTMDKLAQVITPYFNRPVINATGLSGGYEAVIDVGLDEWQAVMRGAGAPCLGSACSAGAQMPSDPSGKSLRASIKKMGLRIAPEKSMIDVIVVDHIKEAPTEN